MKVKVLTRNPDDYLRETKRDIHKVPRNLDPALHPFEAQREYTRALNAVKLDRVFAKPFIGNLDGHRDGVSCLAKHPTLLSVLASGAFDGELRVWNLTSRKCVRTVQAHDGQIRGISFNCEGSHFLSVGSDKTIKFWNSDSNDDSTDRPTNTIISKTDINGISFCKEGNTFATCGEVFQLWEETRNEPIRTLQWGADTLSHISFNPIETSVLASCGNDRSITIYDTRKAGPVRKVTLALKSNQICWNPMEAFTFTVANEDYNLYTFDTRNLSRSVNVHKDHVSAVVSVDYSPTGTEFVSGSYDKTIRIFQASMGHSRDVYHTKRMQRVTNVLWSSDNKYVLSSSDEMNIRIWKSKASEKLGVLKPREKKSLNYSDALKKKFENFPQVKRIARHRQVPKHVLNAQKEHRIIHQKQKIKEANRRKHSKKRDAQPHEQERQKHIVAEHE